MHKFRRYNSDNGLLQLSCSQLATFQMAGDNLHLSKTQLSILGGKRGTTLDSSDISVTSKDQRGSVCDITDEGVTTA